MTFKIPLSAIQALGFDFHQEVGAYLAARIAHSQTLGVAAPLARHELIEAAVRRILPEGMATTESFVADYEVVDDAAAAVVPSPLEKKQPLDQRKMALVQNAAEMAALAYEQNVPRLKARFLSADMGRIVAVPEEQRTPDDSAKLTDYKSRMRRMSDINLHHGKLEAEIADLTEETIADWTPAPFPD